LDASDAALTVARPAWVFYLSSGHSDQFGQPGFNTGTATDSIAGTTDHADAGRASAQLTVLGHVTQWILKPMEFNRHLKLNRSRRRGPSHEIATACLLLVLTQTTAWSQTAADCATDTLSYGTADQVDVDAEQLTAAANMIGEAVRKNRLHGAVVLVARKRKIILHQAYGWRDLARTRPMQRDSLFRMASNSKAVTAAGLLVLVDQGRIGLDDRVRSYFPSFAGPRSARITVRQLLTHTSGLRIPTLFLKPLLQPSAEQPQAPSLLLEVARFGHIEPEQEPGSSWSYNNAGYNSLAGLIEQTTGSYKAHLRCRLYEPLGMRDSSNHESDADHSRMSAVFRKQSDGRWAVGWKPGDAPDYPFARGSGGMISTAGDYAVFCQMLLNGGTYNNHRVLSVDLVQQSTRVQTQQSDASKAYGLGWNVSPVTGVFSHAGSDGTWAWVDPKYQLIGLVFTQTQRQSQHRQPFQECVTRACRLANGL